MMAFDKISGYSLSLQLYLFVSYQSLFHLCFYLLSIEDKQSQMLLLEGSAIYPFDSKPLKRYYYERNCRQVDFPTAYFLERFFLSLSITSFHFSPAIEACFKASSRALSCSSWETFSAISIISIAVVISGGEDKEGRRRHTARYKVTFQVQEVQSSTIDSIGGGELVSFSTEAARKRQRRCPKYPC